MIERMHRAVMGHLGFRINGGVVNTVIDGNIGPLKVLNYKVKIYPAQLEEKEVYVNLINEDIANPTYNVIMGDILDYTSYRYRVAIHAIVETVLEYLNGNVPDDLPTKAIKALQIFKDIKGQAKTLVDETTVDLITNIFSPQKEYYTLGYEIGVDVDDEKYIAGVGVSLDLDLSNLKRRKDKDLAELLSFTAIPTADDTSYLGYSNNKHIPVLLSVIEAHNRILDKLNKIAKMFMVDSERTGLKYMKKIDFDYDLAVLKAEAVEIPDVNIFTGKTSLTASIDGKDMNISVTIDENKNGNNVNEDEIVILNDTDDTEAAIERLSKPVLKRKVRSNSNPKGRKKMTRKPVSEEYEEEVEEEEISDANAPIGLNEVVVGEPIPLNVSRHTRRDYYEDEYDDYDDDYYEDDCDDDYEDLRRRRPVSRRTSRTSARRRPVSSARTRSRPSIRSRYEERDTRRYASRRVSSRSRRPQPRERVIYEDDSVFDDFATIDI